MGKQGIMDVGEMAERFVAAASPGTVNLKHLPPTSLRRLIPPHSGMLVKTLIRSDTLTQRPSAVKIFCEF